MPIINVDVWEVFNEDQKKQWMKELTDVTVNLLNIPPDKVVVVLRDIPLKNWAQAGAVATDPEFITKSRVSEVPKKAE